MTNAASPRLSSLLRQRRLASLGLALLLGLAAPQANASGALAPSATAAADAEWELLQAAGRGQIGPLRRLAARGVDLFARDRAGRSALILGVLGRSQPVVAFMLQQRADVDARDLNGFTALHYAAASGQIQMARLLLKAGASTRVYTKQCASPVDLAAGYDNRRLFALLRQLSDRTPLPVDGAVRECELKPLKEAQATLPATRQRYFRRQLRLQYVDDYGAAITAMQMLQRDPRLGERLADALVGVLNHPTLAGADGVSTSEQLVREVAAMTLIRVVRSPRGQDQLAKILLPIIEGGNCAVFEARSCGEEVVNQCRRSEIVRGVKVLFNHWLAGASSERPPGDEESVCYDCQHCRQTRVGNAFGAAMIWFAAHKTQAPKADAVLGRLAAAQLLPPLELQALRAQLRTGRAP